MGSSVIFPSNTFATISVLATTANSLTIRHEIDKPGARFIDAVSGGWPKILSSLKSLLETGAPLSDIKNPPRA